MQNLFSQVLTLKKGFLMLIIGDVKFTNQQYLFRNDKQLSFSGRIPNRIVKPDYIPDVVWNAEQEILKKTEKRNLFSKLSDTISSYYVKGNYQLMPLLDYATNKIFCNKNLSVEQKISKTNDAFRLYEKLLANNSADTVNRSNPIDITTIVKVMLSELNCKDIKIKGLKNLENGYAGYNTLSAYDSLAELIKFAQTQCKNKDITLKFEKPKALYTTLSYKGAVINNKDLKKILPKTYYYSQADFEKNNIIINNDGISTNIIVKMNTYDEAFSAGK